MEFADTTLISLSTEAGRNALISQTALAHMASAAFDLSLDPIEGPFTLSVETAETGVEIVPTVSVDGTIRAADRPTPNELRLVLRGLRPVAPLRADALWRGELIARRVSRDSVIEDALPAFTALDLDRVIAASASGLPTDPAALEAARRVELLTRLRARMTRPDLLDEAGLLALLEEAGQRDVAGLLGARGGTALGTLRLRFSAPSAGPPEPVRLPVTIAVMVRSAIGSLSAFLAEARALREHLARDAEALPPPAPLRRRVQVLPLLVLPQATFSAPGWPGANRVQRQRLAAEFLQRESVGLAVASP